MSGGLKDAPELFRALKFAIAQVIIERLRAVDAQLAHGHAYLDRVVQPGNVVVTSNWDVALERYAHHRGIATRLTGYDPGEFVVLKLHGSIDWCAMGRRTRGYPDSDYASLRERIQATPYPVKLPTDDAEVVRIRMLENWNRNWSRISSRARDLHMVTMARGKSGDLGPLQEVWRDAYSAISRASRLEIVGYSLPDDDTEIRTLLRAAIQRGGGPKLVTRNPAPDVHERVWRFLDRAAVPDYSAVSPLRP